MPTPRGSALSPLALVLFAACAEPAPAPGGAAIEIEDAEDVAGWATRGGPQFGSIAVTHARIEPGVLRPGEPAVLELHARGVGENVRARIALEPPRSGARQVAQGGVGAPPLSVAEDPRVRAVDVELADGVQSIDLPALPVPWHPRRALVTLALSEGDDAIAATAGPRRQDGVGVLALVPVETSPTAIEAPRTAHAIAIDGVLDEPVWQAGGTPLVESLEGEPWDGPPTTLWAAWDDQALYVAAHAEDRDVWSSFRRHDDPLWEAEVFEVFVFGDDDDRDYLELQVSPRGVTFDARFARHRKADRAWTSTFDAAAHVDGTLDDRDDLDVGWGAEVAIPWAEICAETGAACPPRAGASLRINAFRFERPAEGATVGLALSPTRVPDFHAVANAAILTLK